MHFSVFLGVWFAVERRRGNQKVKVGTAVVEHSTSYFGTSSKLTWLSGD